MSALRAFSADIQWSDFDALDAATVLVGTTSSLTAPRATSGGNSVGIAAIEYVSGGCSYVLDGSDHNITFNDATECVMRVTASGGRGMMEAAREFRFTAGEGAFTLTWRGYHNSNSAMYGEGLVGRIRPRTNPEVEGVEFAYSATGGGCSVDPADDGRLTILGVTDGTDLTCVVTVTATRSGYASVTSDPVTVTIAKGEQRVSSSNPYGSVQALEVNGTLSIVNPPTGGAVTLTYGIKSGGAGCTVASDGTVTGASSTGTCVVSGQLEWKRQIQCLSG